MTIDEAMEIAKEKADTNSECWKHCTSDDDCGFCEEYHKQLAEWLEELKAFKSDDFTQDLLNIGYTKGYRAAIDEFVERIEQYCSMSEMNRKMIQQIAEEMKAGGENEID